jgi:hypothetical protein
MPTPTFTFKYRIWFALLFCSLNYCSIQAQPGGCRFADPLIKIDFGTNASPKNVNLSFLKNYTSEKGSCPDDGYFSFTSHTRNCFNGTWHDVLFDHTAGDTDGRMLIVNAGFRPGTFFRLDVAGLRPGATYQFTFWLVNLHKPNRNCDPIYPSISVSVLTGGSMFNTFRTGEIMPSYFPDWKIYSAIFTMPQTGSALTLQMEDLNNGGCGNDFAMDDISFQECVIPLGEPEKNPESMKADKPEIIKTETKKPVTVQPPVANEKVIEKFPAENKPVIKPVAPVVSKKLAAIPQPIATRENRLIKKIESEESELTIELYDNGEIDGDTVSIYHNNELIRNRAGLSAKPVTIKLNVDALHPHHELVMVADNLGSIPPNTSLMIITSKTKRWEVFISSSEQKNAKIVIDLKE